MASLSPLSSPPLRRSAEQRINIMYTTVYASQAPRGPRELTQCCGGELSVVSYAMWRWAVVTDC